jgi:asparagine synthase (glutamine-hydrolysing)
MCGIVGMFGSAEETTLERMLEVTAHRGEDSTRYKFFDGLCALGINRLSIVDLDKGEQPLRNAAGDVHVVCNGEIYNSPALAPDLRDRHELLTRSDAEVVAPLYVDYGKDCVSFLDGMFGLAVYDQKKRTFMTARDPIGIKPLYYAQEEDERWYFASEAKALLQTGLDAELVRSLPPGHRLTPEDGVEQYYWPPAHRSIANPDLLRELLDHAVRKRLMADVEVGTFLSGGIDSSVVTALAHKHVPGLQAFTVGMEGSPDLEAARLVAKHVGLDNHHIRTFTTDEMLSLIPEAIWHVESYNPSMVSGAVVTLMAARLAKEVGVKVVLCGEGADEILGGYLALRHMGPSQLEQASRTLMDNLHKTELQRLDRMSMAVSLEARVPFLDRGVVEYAMNLPFSAKIKEQDGKRIEKYILRQAVDDLLPKEIVWREKMPFDQGSGGRSIIAVIEEQVSDAEYERERREHPEANLLSKEMLYYYRIWREHFGDMGGRRRFELFGDYPVMMGAIKNRTAKSGS